MDAPEFLWYLTQRENACRKLIMHTDSMPIKNGVLSVCNSCRNKRGFTNVNIERA